MPPAKLVHVVCMAKVPTIMLLVQTTTKTTTTKTMILGMAAKAQAVKAQAVVILMLVLLPTTGSSTESIDTYKSKHIGCGWSQTIGAYLCTRTRWV